MADVKSKLFSAGVLVGMSAVGTLVVPKVTKKATDKQTKKMVTKTTANIDFDNMGPEIVRKDRSSEKE